VFSANVVDMSPTTLVLEAVASPGKLDALLAMLDSYGTCELVRTGRIGLARGASVITDEPDAAVAQTTSLEMAAARQAETAA
jgi:acetolactate synthase I/III small subunit